MRSTVSLLATWVMLTGVSISAAFAADSDLAGQWMITIPAPGVVPYEGLLEFEKHGDEWLAYIENGPAPVSIDGKQIEITLDTRGLTPVKLVRQGWTRKTIKVGDHVKVYGHTGHTNKTIMSILDITLPDGRVLTSGSVAYDIKDVEE